MTSVDSSPESIVHEVMFTWKIENFSRHRQKCAEAIHSPLLSVGEPRHSIWLLKLYPKEVLQVKGTVMTELVRIEGSLKGRVSSQVSLVTSDGNVVETKISSNVCSFLFLNRNKKIAEKEFLKIFLPNNTMTLQCKLTLWGDPHDYVSMTDMSKFAGRLFESGACIDLVLCTENREFSVHRAILRRRAPELFRYLGLLEDPKVERVEVSNISAAVLHRILLYLYRGDLSLLPGNDQNIDLVEMIEVAKRFNLIELTFEAISLSSPATIVTHIHNFPQVFEWAVKPLQTEESQEFSMFIRLGTEHFLAILRIHKEVHIGKNSKGNVVKTCSTLADLSFKCFSVTDKDVHLLCWVSMDSMFKENTESQGTEHRLRFCNNISEQQVCWELSNEPMCEYITPLQMIEGFEVILDLYVFKENETHSVYGQLFSEEFPSIFGMSLLAHDLTSLLEETQTKSGDDTKEVSEDPSKSTDLQAVAKEYN